MDVLILKVIQTKGTYLSYVNYAAIPFVETAEHDCVLRSVLGNLQNHSKPFETPPKNTNVVVFIISIFMKMYNFVLVRTELASDKNNMKVVPKWENDFYSEHS